MEKHGGALCPWHLLGPRANDNIFPIEVNPCYLFAEWVTHDRVALIRVAPKTTLYYLMENRALRLYANVSRRVRHFNGSISMISVGKQAKGLGLIAADIYRENIRG